MDYDEVDDFQEARDGVYEDEEDYGDEDGVEYEDVHGEEYVDPEAAPYEAELEVGDEAMIDDEAMIEDESEDVPPRRNTRDADADAYADYDRGRGAASGGRGSAPAWSVTKVRFTERAPVAAAAPQGPGLRVRGSAFSFYGRGKDREQLYLASLNCVKSQETQLLEALCQFYASRNLE